MYRVATRSSIANLFGERTDPDKPVSRLVKEKLLRPHKGLPGNRTVYQLTKKGAATVGVSPARGRLAGAQSMLKNLGVLLFCQVEGAVRHRVDAEQLSNVLGARLKDAAYCLAHVKGRTIVFECYVPGTETPVLTVVRHLRKLLRDARRQPALVEAIKDLRYGFAVIVQNQSRRKAIMDAVRRKGEDERLPLVKRVRVWVEAAEELGHYLGTAAPCLGSVRDGSSAETL